MIKIVSSQPIKFPRGSCQHVYHASKNMNSYHNENCILCDFNDVNGNQVNIVLCGYCLSEIETLIADGYEVNIGECKSIYHSDITNIEHYAHDLTVVFKVKDSNDILKCHHCLTRHIKSNAVFIDLKKRLTLN